MRSGDRPCDQERATNRWVGRPDVAHPRRSPGPCRQAVDGLTGFGCVDHKQRSASPQADLGPATRGVAALEGAAPNSTRPPGTPGGLSGFRDALCPERNYRVRLRAAKQVWWSSSAVQRRHRRRWPTCSSPSSSTTSPPPRPSASLARCGRPAWPAPWPGASRGASGAASCSSNGKILAKKRKRGRPPKVRPMEVEAEVPATRMTDSPRLSWCRPASSGLPAITRGGVAAGGRRDLSGSTGSCRCAPRFWAACPPPGRPPSLRAATAPTSSRAPPAVRM